MKNPLKRQKDKKRLRMTSFILHPTGRVYTENVKSHRAFRFQWGLYGVDSIFAFKDGERMMLHSAGNPVPWEGGSNINVGEKMFNSFWIRILSFMGGKPRRPFILPQWAVIILVFILIFLIVQK